MGSRDDFAVYELPRLLSAARELGVISKLSCILLYGSANYYNSIREESIPIDHDYDCWVFFSSGNSRAAHTFSNFLFAEGGGLLKRPLRKPVLLYEKIPSRHLGRVLAPFITTTDVLVEILDAHNNARHRSDLVESIPWYRITPRKRNLLVPATAFNKEVKLLDLHQRFVKLHNLWRLDAPVFVLRRQRYYLSFAVEAFLTSSVVFEAEETVSQAIAKLARSVAKLMSKELPSSATFGQQAELVYNAFTISQKAPPEFRKECLERIINWISQ